MAMVRQRNRSSRARGSYRHISQDRSRSSDRLVADPVLGVPWGQNSLAPAHGGYLTYRLTADDPSPRCSVAVTVVLLTVSQGPWLDILPAQS